MRKQLIIIGMILLLLVGINGCQAQPIISGRGTVNYISLAGGFWGIISDKSHNGTNYFEPIFMPFRFRHDGLHIWFIIFCYHTSLIFKGGVTQYLFLKLYDGYKDN
jgi:hypothetical protein